MKYLFVHFQPVMSFLKMRMVCDFNLHWQFRNPFVNRDWMPCTIILSGKSANKRDTGRRNKEVPINRNISLLFCQLLSSAIYGWLVCRHSISQLSTKHRTRAYYVHSHLYKGTNDLREMEIRKNASFWPSFFHTLECDLVHFEPSVKM